MDLKSIEPCVIALAGPIASGKTSIALALVKRTGWKIAAFGDYLRLEAARRGLQAHRRDVLQRFGDELIALGWEPFCNSVLMETGWEYGEGLIIDGIRHLEALAQIERLVQPLRLKLVYVEIDEESRLERYQEKHENCPALNVVEQHSSEDQVKTTLRIAASLIVNGANEPDKNADVILKWTG